MTISIEPGINYIAVFPGTSEVPCNQYDEYLSSIVLSASWKAGVVGYIPNDMFNFFTSFIPGSGVYIVHALSSFEIEYN